MEFLRDDGNNRKQKLVFLQQSETSINFSRQNSRKKKEAVSSVIGPGSPGPSRAKLNNTDPKQKQKLFQCELCSRQYKHKSSLIRHIKMHNGERNHRCEVCESTFTRSDQLKMHKKTHGPQELFRCTVCNFICKTAVGLKSHMGGHKRNGDTDLQTYSEPRLFRCAICACRYKRESSLIRHIKMHNADHNYRCAICEAAFTSRDQLKIHVKTHRKQELLQCTVCARRCKTTAGLKSHMRGHKRDGDKDLQTYSEQRLFRCAICACRYKHKSSLNRHIKMHNAERNHRCEICESAFTSSGHLKNHSKIHGNQTPFRCTVCDRGFKTAIGLKSHASACNGTRHTLANSIEESRLHISRETNEERQLECASNLRQIPCVHCGTTFVEAAKTEIKLRTQFLRLSCEYNCQACTKSFPRPDNLYKHLMDAHTMKFYQCALCEMVFNSEILIKMHFTFSHNNASRTWMCVVCGDSAGAMLTEAEGAAHVISHHASRCPCGAILSDR